jgi:hypothetical protein
MPRFAEAFRSVLSGAGGSTGGCALHCDLFLPMLIPCACTHSSCRGKAVGEQQLTNLPGVCPSCTLIHSVQVLMFIVMQFLLLVYQSSRARKTFHTSMFRSAACIDTVKQNNVQENKGFLQVYRCHFFLWRWLRRLCGCLFVLGLALRSNLCATQPSALSINSQKFKYHHTLPNIV